MGGDKDDPRRSQCHSGTCRPLSPLICTFACQLGANFQSYRESFIKRSGKQVVSSNTIKCLEVALDGQNNHIGFEA